MFTIIFTRNYNKRAKQFIKKHPGLLKQYEKTLKLLELNPFHPSLRLHKMERKLKDIYSVSINISYRITIDLILENNVIIPIDAGKHDEMY